ncbi:39558_t:CDS:2 [Gigaspora margarita]|uniref:39558_t:CDS:1 n=1 Tax=Gigaspora margarita TaxID=4874 RepID=A0ABN7UTN1_GIGMA|nr:39558_t:CDS:2 [Gigaspora margarita]
MPNYYFYQVLSRSKGFIGFSYNERYRKLTFIMHGILSQRNVKEKSDLIDLKYRILMQNLKPQSTKMMVFILKISSTCSLEHYHSYKCSQTYKKLGDLFPILKWFSGNKFYNKVIEHRKVLESFYGSFVKEVKDDKEKKPCAIRDLLNKVDEGILDKLDIVHMTDNIFFAGTDTISASLTWIVAALANNPQVQSKAHEELDRVVGQSRLPTILDEPNISYIRAIIKEANSAAVFNIYGIHMDEKIYENPKEFNPERFLAGRRFCTGIHLAELELLLGVSRLLWSFKIENASPLGKNGKPIPINLDKARLGINVWPEEYHVKLVKRHDNVEKILFDISQ